MADQVTNYSGISNDAVSYWIAAEQIKIAERRLVLGQFAKKFNLPQRLGKTLRVDRWQYMSLPIATLTEGTPPDAVTLGLDVTNVTVEQWGIVALLTDVAQITTTHPVMTAANERISQAMEQVIEREMAGVLLGGTNVRYATGVASRGALDGTKKLTTADVISCTAFLRANGAGSYEGDLMGGVMPPQVEGDLLGSDTTFQQASNFANVRALQYAEIGVWMGVRWVRGNFLPIYQGQVAPDANAASGTLAGFDAKPKVLAIDGGGSINSGVNFKFAVVWRDKTTDMERHITPLSGNIASAATGNNESFTIDVPASSLTNYYYDVYMTTVAGAGSGSLYKVLSRQTTATSAAITAGPAGTETTLTTPPAAGKAVFIGWVFGRDAFGRVELDGMSLASYITPDGSSYSNPLNQGRKVGSKVMWKSWILDNNFFIRYEANSAQPTGLPA
jgi:N4-gp56 family major capsid protein